MGIDLRSATRLGLFREVDGAWLVALRVLLSLCVSSSMLRWIAYGRVDALFVTPRFHFKYWGFAWVQALPAAAMHALVWMIACLALAMAAGFCFRLVAILVWLGFTYLQLIDVTSYLNHYYLICLLLLLLASSPAGRIGSLDSWLATRRSTRAASRVDAFWLYLFRFQIAVVYTFAALAKLQSDWLVHAQPLRIWLAARVSMPVIGPIFMQPWAAPLLSWGGFLFDASIPWLLAIPATRWAAALAVLVFHALTYLLFPAIGMFPIVMIVSASVFLTPSWPRTAIGFVPKTSAVVAAPCTTSPPSAIKQRMLLTSAAIYCAIQLLIPLRFLAYGGNVLWHEQGFRFSWRVMVRVKGTTITFLVRNRATGQTWYVRPESYVNRLQQREMAEQPDLILQLAHHIAEDFDRRKLGPVAVHAEALVSLNGRALKAFIDPNVDLATTPDGIGPARWVLPAPNEPPPHIRAIAPQPTEHRSRIAM